jgi:hypothetical protein
MGSMGEPVFPPSGDFASLASFGKELFIKSFRRVIVYPFTTTIDNLEDSDDIYGEDFKKSFPLTEAFETACLIAALPSKKQGLTKEGIDETRELIAAFNKALLESQGKKLPDIGWHILIERERYKILSTNPTDYFANFDSTFTHTVNIMRYQPRSASPHSSTIYETYP